jgi:hypothetical protein
MSKNTTPSRKQRRDQLRAMGYLKIKNMYSPLEGPGKAWADKAREDGKAAQEAFLNKVQDDIENQLQTKLNGIKESWKEQGYNDAEIKMLEEAWSLVNIKNKETYREDKKESARLQKQARESLNSRLDADS